MGEMKRRMPPQVLISAAGLVVVFVMIFGLSGPFTEADEALSVASTDDALMEAAFYVT